ncbi:structural cement protein Gp24 [Marinicauda sp. Alg238-R41]|uniref:structural cement protein Gp24 n=1 Tax=Marinicauda sp. Alg238-R41 TaxID=2993447 RepID=UPI0022E66B64|nr:hypothetical protein [Marinicauda sp. Alg238-R41]
MAVVQSTYAAGMSAAIAGLIANMEQANVVTRQVQDTGGIGFGKAVFQGTADGEITETASALFVGVTVKDVTVDNATADTYALTANAGVLESGVIWVTAGDAVTAGAAVSVAADGNFEADASGNQTIDAIFLDSGSDGDLVRIRVR